MRSTKANIEVHYNNGKEYWMVKLEDGRWFVVKVKYILSPRENDENDGSEVKN